MISITEAEKGNFYATELNDNQVVAMYSDNTQRAR